MAAQSEEHTVDSSPFSSVGGYLDPPDRQVDGFGRDAAGQQQQQAQEAPRLGKAAQSDAERGDAEDCGIEPFGGPQLSDQPPGPPEPRVTRSDGSTGSPRQQTPPASVSGHLPRPPAEPCVAQRPASAGAGAQPAAAGGAQRRRRPQTAGAGRAAISPAAAAAAAEPAPPGPDLLAEAARRLGVTPDELRSRRLSEFREVDLPAELRRQRWELHEQQRERLSNLVEQEAVRLQCLRKFSPRCFSSPPRSTAESPAVRSSARSVASSAPEVLLNASARRLAGRVLAARKQLRLTVQRKREQEAQEIAKDLRERQALQERYQRLSHGRDRARALDDMRRGAAAEAERRALQRTSEDAHSQDDALARHRDILQREQCAEKRRKEVLEWRVDSTRGRNQLAHAVVTQVKGERDSDRRERQAAAEHYREESSEARAARRRRADAELRKRAAAARCHELNVLIRAQRTEEQRTSAACMKLHECDERFGRWLGCKAVVMGDMRQGRLLRQRHHEAVRRNAKELEHLAAERCNMANIVCDHLSERHKLRWGSTRRLLLDRLTWANAEKQRRCERARRSQWHVSECIREAAQRRLGAHSDRVAAIERCKAELREEARKLRAAGHRVRCAAMQGCSTTEQLRQLKELEAAAAAGQLPRSRYNSLVEELETGNQDGALVPQAVEEPREAA